MLSKGVTDTMEFGYRKRKNITRIAVVSLVFILLLLLNFKELGGTYSQGDLKNILANQLNEFEYCILSNNANIINVNDSAQIKQLTDTGFIGIIIDCILLLFIHSISIYRNKLFCARRYTLVSLCVRMDE